MVVKHTHHWVADVAPTYRCVCETRAVRKGGTMQILPPKEPTPTPRIIDVEG